MLWARVMRGISSMERKVTPRSARARAASAAVSGSPKPMTVWPWRRSGEVGRAGLGVRARAAHLQDDFGCGEDLFAVGARRTPFSTYSESGKPAGAPAPGSIRSSTPVLFKTEMALGTIATRRSPGDVSATIPTMMPTAGSVTIGDRPWRPVLQQFRGAEEEGQFDRGRLRGVRAVDAVALDVGRRTACGWCPRRRWPGWWRPSLRATS